jgi:carboxypeptidase C (cathepsin A)
MRPLQVGHVVYIESPTGVGFSYTENRSNDDVVWDDDTVLSLLFHYFPQTLPLF